MATVIFKMKGNGKDWSICGHDLRIDLDASNIEALEAACAAYRKESRLPETMEECRINLWKLAKGTAWHLTDHVREMNENNTYNFTEQTDPNFFPARWQAEKLHALACLIQIQAALNTFQPMLAGVGTWNLYGFDERGGTIDLTFIPFNTIELRDHAMNMPGVKELIQVAFKNS